MSKITFWFSFLIIAFLVLINFCYCNYNEKILDENKKLNTEVCKLNSALKWDKDLKDKIKKIKLQWVDVGAYIENMKKNIDEKKFVNKSELDNMPILYHELTITENILKHGYEKYNWNEENFGYPTEKDFSFITWEYQMLRLHAGIDINNLYNRDVFNVADGKIVSINYNDIYGKHIRIFHKIDGEYYYTIYAHLSAVKVKLNQFVKKGQKIGIMGNTGKSDGTHLHFSIQKYFQDKRNYLSINPVSNTTYNIPVNTFNYDYF